jgi:hypothetical protein
MKRNRWLVTDELGQKGLKHPDIWHGGIEKKDDIRFLCRDLSPGAPEYELTFCGRVLKSARRV